MASSPDDALAVEIASGTVRGSRSGSLRSWKGIPYAAPPVGRLRFVRPQPAERWEGVRDTVEYGHAAYQHVNKAVSLPPGMTMSEDCLTLNVLAPEADAGGVLKPVMVWIHGGAYFAGSSAQPLFEGTHLVENGDVVLVTVNYRLGALGFLDFRAIATESEPFDTNLGLRDQLAALAWVQTNIRAFGGDPGNVTLFGESAGGGCVTTLLTSPAATGLFHRAIAESSPATSVYGQERAARVARQYLGMLGVDPGEPEKLRELSALNLTQAAFELIGLVAAEQPGTLAIAPVVDGDIVPLHPIEAYEQGTQLPLPLIIGTNRDEASLFKLMKSPLMPITSSSVHSMFEEILAERPDLADAEPRIETAYPAFPRRHTPAELARDAGFRMPSIWLAAAHARVAPTWMYRFDFAPPMLKLLGIGATHGAEIAYVFGNLHVMRRDPSFRLGGAAEAARVSSALQHRWLAFAAAGSPLAEGGGDDWPRYDGERRATLVVDGRQRVVDDPDSAIRQAWGDEVIGFD
jgi:para-nitrobenzyl esterase